MTVDISTISTGSSSSGKASKSTGASSDRDKFNNKFEYFFTALSYAVGKLIVGFGFYFCFGFWLKRETSFLFVYVCRFGQRLALSLPLLPKWRW